MTSEQRKLIDAIDLSLPEKAIIRAIADKGEQCFMFQERLARSIGTSVRSLQRHLSSLKRLGLIDGGQARGRQAVYRVVWEAFEVRQVGVPGPPSWRTRSATGGGAGPPRVSHLPYYNEIKINPPLSSHAGAMPAAEQNPGGGKLFEVDEKPKPAPRTTEGREQAEVVGLLESFYAACGPLWRASRYGQASLANRGPRPEPGGHVRPAEVDLLVDAWVEHSPEVLRAAMRELPKRLLAQFPSCKQLLGARPYLAELCEEIKRRWAQQADEHRKREAEQEAARERRARDALEAAERRESLERLRSMPEAERAELEGTMPAFVRRQSIAVQEMWLVTQLQRPVQAELFSEAARSEPRSECCAGETAAERSAD